MRSFLFHQERRYYHSYLQQYLHYPCRLPLAEIVPACSRRLFILIIIFLVVLSYLLKVFSSDKAFSKEAREQVKYVVMDMSPLFKLVIQTMVLYAHIVADHYHVCRLVDWALDRVKLLEILRISNDLRLAYGLRLAFRRM